jgi:phytoene dehydrogenase-like protein
MNGAGGRFDAIVIGSGIGGLACAAALTRSGLKVPVLEKHFTAGGLTQTFSREGFTWAVGLHYLGDMGEGGSARRVNGGIYGLEASPRRFLSTALRAKTPVAGLYLTGQDVGTAGIAGAMMGGMLSAASLEPKLFSRIA